MRILLTGGGSGGHFYPLIAVAEELNRIAREEKLVKPELYFMSDEPYDQKALFDNDIEFRRVPAGKLRRYASLQNALDVLKTTLGVIRALVSVFWIYPDVIFSKGGYGSFPATFAARILRIPLFIHESDTVPGRANGRAGKQAARIAVTFAETAQYFPKTKVAWTGTPIRNALREVAKEGAHELLQFEKTVPTILVLGGSLGAEIINNAILDSLPNLVNEFQIIHQTGEKNLTVVSGISKTILEKNAHAARYKPFDFLHDEALTTAAGASDLVVSRAGAGALSEIALWGKPSLIIPITDSNGDHQRKNAIAYENAGACIVIEEANLKPHILITEIRRIIGDQKLRERMSENALKFANTNRDNP